MTAKIMISIPDELKVMVDEYNKKHMFRKLHISEICQEAIYNAIIKDEGIYEIPYLKEVKIKPVTEDKQVLEECSDKPVILCPICGKEFVQTKQTKKYCSKNCATTACKRRKKDAIK